MGRFRRLRTPLSGPEANAAAFSDLVSRHRPALLRAATGLEGGPVAGEELLQGALARTWNHFDPMWDDRSFLAYVRVAMVNAQRSRWRRPLREDPHDTIERPGVMDDHSRVDDADQLDRALRQLSDRQRTVVVMRYYDDLSEQQTALALSCSVGTVKSQTSRAISRLRRLLEVTHVAPASAEPAQEAEVGVPAHQGGPQPGWASSDFDLELAGLNIPAGLDGLGRADDPTGEFPALV